MHPLSYQPTKVSCWVTSMINGLLFLSSGKDLEDPPLVPPKAYEALHKILSDEGVYYYTQAQLKELDKVLDIICQITKYRVIYHSKERVEPAIHSLHFRNQVAVCDIEAGEHSILLNGGEGNWIYAFDPYWANVNQPEFKKNCYEIQPHVELGLVGVVNLKVDLGYFLSKRSLNGFQLGAVSKRFLTVIEKS